MGALMISKIMVFVKAEPVLDSLTERKMTL